MDSPAAKPAPAQVQYVPAAKVAKTAYEKNLTLKEAAVQLGLISAEEFDKQVRPEKMISG